jgi:hypothetical protein
MPSAAAGSTVVGDLGTYSPACVHGHRDWLHPERCVCSYGWGGAACDAFVLPACVTSGSPLSTVTCAVLRPLSCACVRQCLQAGAFAGHIQPFCFERTDASNTIPLAADFSAQPPLSRFFRWRQSRPGAQPSFDAWASWEEALRFKTQAAVRVVPVSWCRSRCSYRGTCVLHVSRLHRARAGEGGCDCDAGFGGTHCEREATRPTAAAHCPADCSGRGACEHGACVCEAPYFGTGCALPLPLPPAPRRRGRRRPEKPPSRGGPPQEAASSGLRIGVYDLPALVVHRRQYAATSSVPPHLPWSLLTDRFATDSASLTLVPADVAGTPRIRTRMRSSPRRGGRSTLCSLTTRASRPRRRYGRAHTIHDLGTCTPSSCPHP